MKRGRDDLPVIYNPKPCAKCGKVLDGGETGWRFYDDKAGRWTDRVLCDACYKTEAN